MQKSCVSRWAPSDDVHSTPTFWCQRVPERGIPTKDRGWQRGMPSERTISLWWYSVWHLLPCHGRKQSSSTHLSRGGHWALHVLMCLHTNSNIMISLHIRVENVMDHEFHCNGYCVPTVNNCSIHYGKITLQNKCWQSNSYIWNIASQFVKKWKILDAL